MAMQLTASGFTGHLHPLNGVYTPSQNNHGKPQYTKPTTEIEGCTQSCVYFWDNRDGDHLSGWWVAPIAGGEQVWAFNPTKSPNPPPTGWRVPWHSEKPNPQLRVVLAKVQPPAPQKRPAEEQVGGPAKVAKTVAGRQSTGGSTMTAAQQSQRTAQQEKFIKQLDSQHANAEKAVNRAKESTDRQELARLVHVAKNSINSLKKSIEACQKGPLFPADDQKKLEPIAEKVAKLEADLTNHESETNKAALKKAKELTDDLPANIKKFLKTLGEIVEEMKDDTVVLTCELGDHSAPEDVCKVDDLAESHSKKAQEKMKEMKAQLTDCEATFRSFSDLENLEELKKQAKECRDKMVGFEKEISGVKKHIAPAVARARSQIAAKKREEEREALKKEQIRRQEEAHRKITRATEIGLYSDCLKRQLDMEKSSDSDIQTVQAQLLGLLRLLEDDYADKTALPGLKNALAKKIQSIRKELGILATWNKERMILQGQERDQFETILAAEFAKKIEEKELDKEGDAFYRLICGADPEEDIDGVQLRFTQLKKWICSEILGDDGEESAEKHLGPSYQRAVIAKKQMEKIKELAAKKKEKGEEEGSKEETAEDPLDVSVDLETAKKVAIGFPEFFMFIQNSLWVVTSRVGLAEDKESTKSSQATAHLEVDDVVACKEGPDSPVPAGQPSAGMVRMEVSRVKDNERGWMTLRSKTGAANCMEKYSNVYTIQTETVLTDTYELKGFKVIRRVKKNEKCVALSMPKLSGDSTLLRVRVMSCVDGAVGFITVKGSQGTLFLTSDVLGKATDNKKKQHGNPSGLEINKDGDDWKLITEEQEITEIPFSDDLHTANITKMAEKIPLELKGKLGKLAELKEKLQDGLTSLENQAEKVTSWEKPEVKEGEEVDPLKHDFPPFVDSTFDTKVTELVTEVDTSSREVSKELAQVRKEAEFLLADLRDVYLEPEFMKKKKPAKTEKKQKPAESDDAMEVEGEEKKEEEEEKKEEEDLIPDLTSLSPFQMLRYEMYQLVGEFDGYTSFLRNVQTKKIAARQVLDKLWHQYKKALDRKDLQEQVAKLQEGVASKAGEIAAAELAVSEIMDTVSPRKEVPESDEKVKPRNLADVLAGCTLSSAILAQKTVELDEKLKALNEISSEMTLWVLENHYAKSCTPAQGTRMSHQERQDCIAPVTQPFDQLRRSVQAAKTYAAKNLDYIANDLNKRIVLQARVEIAEHFLKHDPKEVFDTKLAPKNEENASIENAEKKTINCTIICNYIAEVFPHPIPSTVIEKIYCSLVGSLRRPMDQDEFVNLLAKMHYRVLKATALTDKFDLSGPFKALKKLQATEVVRLVGPFETTSQGVNRFKAETVPQTGGDSITGYCTLKGNAGTEFFALNTPGYIVKKETVMTDIFEMCNFKPVLRLKVGDQVRTIGFPRREPGSGLVRVKATTVGNKTKGESQEFTGYVTVEGNQNSTYLSPCETLKFPEEPKEEEEKAEEKAEVKAEVKANGEAKPEANGETKPEASGEAMEVDSEGA